MLGILACGRCYLPLDPNAPPAHQQRILEDARATAVIGEDATTNLPQLDPERIEPADLSACAPTLDALAAILYTSGFTGTPKGVAFKPPGDPRFQRLSCAAGRTGT